MCPRVDPPPSSAVPAAAQSSDALSCLPVVSGCGCAYACARSVRVLDGGAHEVAHDLQDSRLDRAAVERWCFDAAGRGAPARSASPSQTRCLEVFFDGSGCGGECIPRVYVLACAPAGPGCTTVP